MVVIAEFTPSTISSVIHYRRKLVSSLETYSGLSTRRRSDGPYAQPQSENRYQCWHRSRTSSHRDGH